MRKSDIRLDGTLAGPDEYLDQETGVWLIDMSLPNTLHGDIPRLSLCDCGVVYQDYRERLNCKARGCESLSLREFYARAEEVGYKVPPMLTSN